MGFRKASGFFQMFVAGFSTYAACSLALTAIYFARLEDGIGGPATPPLMLLGFSGLALALVSLCVMVAIGCRCVWRFVAGTGRAAA